MHEPRIFDLPYLSKMEEVLHLFITNNCRHNCKLCCNKFYKIDEIPVVTVELLESIQTVCLTGGEPFSINSDVLKLFIHRLRAQYSNIENLYIYTSGTEFGEYCHNYENLIRFNYINGINVAPKDWKDWKWFADTLENHTLNYSKENSNRLYVFKDQKPIFEAMGLHLENVNIQVIDRIWDRKFNTPPNEHFARLPILF